VLCGPAGTRKDLNINERRKPTRQQKYTELVILQRIIQVKAGNKTRVSELDPHWICIFGDLGSGSGSTCYNSA